jgi:hypothetical protein
MTMAHLCGGCGKPGGEGPVAALYSVHGEAGFFHPLCAVAVADAALAYQRAWLETVRLKHERAAERCEDEAIDENGRRVGACYLGSRDAAPGDGRNADWCEACQRRDAIHHKVLAAKRVQRLALRRLQRLARKVPA